MPQATREIKRRIRSITNTKKITKTMELVAAAKMRRAVEAVIRSNAYADRAWEVIHRLAKETESGQHPLLARRPKIKGVAVVLLTSNRGLCGAFNTNAVKSCLDHLHNLPAGVKLELITLGVKGARALKRAGYEVTADFNRTDQTSSVAEISSLGKMLVDGYRLGRYDQVTLIYTDFESTLKQWPRALMLLPLNVKPDSKLGEVKDAYHTRQVLAADEVIFEPDIANVLEFLLPRLFEIQIYQE